MELKHGYKQTEVGVIPKEWDVRPLGEGIGLLSGQHVLAQYCNTEGRGKPYLTGPADFAHGVIKNTKFTEKPSTLCRQGDILVTVKGSGAGTIVVANGEYCISRQLMAIRPFYWDTGYVYESLRRDASLFGAAATGLIPGLSRADILGKTLASPPLSEQRAIATALSDVDRLLAGLDLLIAKKRDLKQAAMQQLLTGQTRLPGFHGEWVETALGDIGECIIGLTYKPENVVKHGLLVLRSSNVQNGRIAYDDNVYVNLEVAEHLYTQVGDLLICVRNGSRALIGKCAVIDQSAADLTFGAFMAIYRTKHWRFVVHAFKGDDIQRQIRDNIGATINQITNKDMKSFRIKLPPEAEQTAIAEVLREMDTELAALEQQREKTRALKQAMMQELLTGRTRLVSPAAAASTGTEA